MAEYNKRQYTDLSGLNLKSRNGVLRLETPDTIPTTTSGEKILYANSSNKLVYDDGSSVTTLGAPATTGTGLMQYAQARYVFATDGGAVSTITLAGNTTLPANAIILGGTINVTTQLTSGGSATVAIGTSAGSSTTSILNATAVASFTTGQLAMEPVFTAASYVKLSAAGQITVTIATAALTAGVMDIILVYVVGAA